jgi:hypothetical protein
MKITIELTQEEEIYLATNSLARVCASAIEAVPNDYEYMTDLEELRRIMEPLRFKLADAVFRVKLAEAQEKK